MFSALLPISIKVKNERCNKEQTNAFPAPDGPPASVTPLVKKRLARFYRRLVLAAHVASKWTCARVRPRGFAPAAVGTKRKPQRQLVKSKTWRRRRLNVNSVAQCAFYAFGSRQAGDRRLRSGLLFAGWSAASDEIGE